jgi:hypothetical protein
MLDIQDSYPIVVVKDIPKGIVACSSLSIADTLAWAAECHRYINREGIRCSVYGFQVHGLPKPCPEWPETHRHWTFKGQWKPAPPEVTRPVDWDLPGGLDTTRTFVLP